MRPKVLWQDEAEVHGADLARVQVWDALSELFLDSERNDEEQLCLAEVIADSPFSFEELAHILFFEVVPVCGPNLFSMAGEWSMFDPDWLIEKCLKQQTKHKFLSKGDPNKAPLIIRTLRFGPYSEAYLLLCRAKNIRAGRVIT